jgi:uncharacterized protein YwqG
MKKSEIIKRLHQAELSTVATKLEPHLRHSIRITTVKVDEEGAIPIGASKMGGHPDVPKGFIWPEHHIVAMSFLAQFDLSEVAPFDEYSELPATGMLYFFSDESNYRGYDGRSWEVLYLAEKPDSLERVEFPDKLPENDGSWYIPRLAPHAVRFSIEAMWPNERIKSDYEKLGLTRLEIARFRDFQSQIQFADRPKHRLLGYPDGYCNSDMQFDCALFANNAYWDYAKLGYNLQNLDAERRQKIEAEYPGWRLLFQIDSDMDFPWMFSDLGTESFWIHHDDLMQRRFDKTCLTGNCG